MLDSPRADGQSATVVLLHHSSAGSERLCTVLLRHNVNEGLTFLTVSAWTEEIYMSKQQRMIFARLLQRYIYWLHLHLRRETAKSRMVFNSRDAKFEFVEDYPGQAEKVVSTLFTKISPPQPAGVQGPRNTLLNPSEVALYVDGAMRTIILPDVNPDHLHCEWRPKAQEKISLPPVAQVRICLSSVWLLSISLAYSVSLILPVSLSADRSHLHISHSLILTSPSPSQLGRFDSQQ